MSVKERKIAIMGLKGVGKTSLCTRFVQGQFEEDCIPTISNFFNTSRQFKNEDYDLIIVDTAGQDEYSPFPTQYSIDIHGYVLVYSITSSKSFEVVKIIHDKLVDMLGVANVPIVLVGNKTDLQFERMISIEEGRKLADSWNAAFIETSAKDDFAVKDLFHTMLLEIDNANNGYKNNNCVIY
ncbi:GTP-binding protein Rheb homolog [Nilaparvata lugens]|uniref:GTP-binding protein Rheb homolog n=1 Tax=Nilaparvata lugens TaxID=108931 RepID=UPI000B991BC4|nr:GTP-binding protein Rheb homolog [Nilaparvata lugens]